MHSRACVNVYMCVIYAQSAWSLCALITTVDFYFLTQAPAQMLPSSPAFSKWLLNIFTTQCVLPRDLVLKIAIT